MITAVHLMFLRLGQGRLRLTATALVASLGLSLGAGCSSPDPRAVSSSAVNPEASPTAETVAEPASVPPASVPPTLAPVAVFTADGIAIGGADPVAYFTDNAYVPGDAAYSHEWGAATWYFASADHRDRFAANPENYAPQYGGYCAWAVSQGYTAAIDPTAWTIVEGKLYLNYSAGIQRRWAQDIPGNIVKADQNWPGVLKK